MSEGTVPKNAQDIEVPVVPLMPGTAYVIISARQQPDGKLEVQLATHGVDPSVARTLLINMAAKVDDTIRRSERPPDPPRVQLAGALPPTGKII